MGLFDTLLLEPVFICPRCGKEHASLQTKLFDSSMRQFRVGMLVTGSPVHTGIIKESIWCCPGSRLLADGRTDDSLELWLIVWHHIFAGYALDADTARQKMNSIDRLDLLGWLDRMQQERLEWKSRYSALHHDLRQYLEYRDLSAEEKAGLDSVSDSDDAKSIKRSINRISLGLMDKEIINSNDPLKMICSKHGSEQPVDHGFFGWD